MLAVIGGTGFSELVGLEGVQGEDIETPYGMSYVEGGEIADVPVLFLPRHGHPPRFPPHRINYRANIDSLARMNVDEIVAVSVVGSVDPLLSVGDLIVPDQIIDYTRDRDGTFFDDEISHIDFTFPYDESVRQKLISALQSLPDDRYQTTGVYGCTQGPRLETAAEVRRLANDGCSIVGMTAMPEAALAREKEIAYAGISLVVNSGAGLNDQEIDLDGISTILEQGMLRTTNVIEALIRNSL